VDVYKTEEEQFDTIKKWIKDNGTGVAIVIFVVAAFFGGRSYWQSHNQANFETTYVEFEQASTLRDGALVEGADEKAFKAYINAVDQLKNDQSKHALTDLAVLKMAADFADKGRWDDAEAELRWLQQNEVVPALQSLVALRLGQVLFQKNQLKEALSVLNSASAGDDDYLPRIKELEGDILLEMKSQPKALKAYRAAAKSNSEKGLSSPALQWKIDDLAGVN